MNAIDDARSAVNNTRRALRRDDCHEAIASFIHGANKIGVAEGMARFLPPGEQDRILRRGGIEDLMAEFRGVHDRLETCVRPPPRRKVRGFVRTTGQMKSRRRRRRG
jgi:hypothetical protein